MSKILIVLFILVAIVLLIAISTVVFIGAGYVFSVMLPLTLFQSVLLCIGATFVVAFITAAIVIGNRLLKILEFDEDENDEDDFDEDEDYDEDFDEDEEEEDLPKRQYTYVKANKVGRNDPCPCGSGKKYKNCCGK